MVMPGWRQGQAPRLGARPASHERCVGRLFAAVADFTGLMLLALKEAVPLRPARRFTVRYIRAFRGGRPLAWRDVEEELSRAKGAGRTGCRRACRGLRNP